MWAEAMGAGAIVRLAGLKGNEMKQLRSLSKSVKLAEHTGMLLRAPCVHYHSHHPESVPQEPEVPIQKTEQKEKATLVLCLLN